MGSCLDFTFIQNKKAEPGLLREKSLQYNFFLRKKLYDRS
ncbi:hypothetical protein LEP1GSC059_4450 [Leptospira noguchii serovar Panama str. CZ214]|uniref:Uncharacterized protein n=1 Tax=Leptospira noguchii serovar Panama str. CZ214 TaxID=1001595 RepID=T0FG66_9LEPT|nr:hypothetical protein LEP1GSC059_4450 [Leptospira noguchii serovar Panama str. CZ214]